VVEPAELAGDRREGGRDDRLVDGGQEHPQHQPAEDHQDLAMGQDRVVSVVMGS
jgi:hypothetical protein